MIANSEKEFILDKYNDDDLLSTLLRYGLFIGAIFQLVCIASSIILPGNDSCADGEGGAGNSGDTTLDVTGARCCTAGEALSNVRRLHKLRKQEKKKRR